MMATTSQRLKEQGNAFSKLDVPIETLNLAKERSTITPAKAAFGSVGSLLDTIRVRCPTPQR